MYFIFLIVVILTAIALVVAAMTIAKLIAPRSFNPQKGEPYECGIPKSHTNAVSLPEVNRG